MSLETENWRVSVEVAKVLAAVAVTDRLVKPVVRTGVPTICTVFAVTFDSDSPVLLSSGAEKVTAFPEPAKAVNWRGEA